LLFTTRKVTGEAGTLLQTWKIVEHHVEIAGDIIIASRKCAEAQIFKRSHVGNDAASLHDLKNAAAHDLVASNAVDPPILEDDFAAPDLAVLGFEQTRNGLQRRGFARPIGPQQSNHRALRHLNAYATQHEDHVVIDDLDVADREQCWSVACGARLPAKGMRIDLLHRAISVATESRLQKAGGLSLRVTIRANPTAAAGRCLSLFPGHPPHS